MLALVNGEVCDWRVGEIQLERLPARAVVEGDVHARLRARVEQPAPRSVFAYDAREGAVGNARVDLLPTLSVVARLGEVGLEVVPLVHRRRDVGGGRVVRRSLDGVYLYPLGHVLRRDVRPRLPVVARQLYEAVVRASPDDSL